MDCQFNGTTRRQALATLAAGGTLPLLVSAQTAGAATADDLFRSDWDFLVGRWNVRHAKRKAFLQDAEWQKFEGTCSHLKMMAGQSNVEDYLIHQPSGTYRAMGIRAFDPKDQLWSIWWIDSRYPTAQMAPPMRGRFRRGDDPSRKLDTFEGIIEETANGRKVMTRFLWNNLDTEPHWEQAMSTDQGATWETNWTMDFRRA